MIRIVKSFSVLIISLLMFGCSDGQNHKNDLEDLNLNGAVKTVNFISYNTQQKFDEISKGKKDYEYKMVFNENGNKVEEIQSYQKIIFNYNSQGQLIEKKQLNSEGDLDSKWTYKYNEVGDITEENYLSLKRNYHEKLIYKYNKKGKLIKKTSYFESGNTGDKVSYQYNKEGKLNKKKIDDFSSGITVIKYLYNKKGTLIQNNLNYYREGQAVNSNKPSYSGVYKKFNDQNNLTEIKRSKYTTKRTFEYVKYDSHNNWIKRIVYMKGNPELIQEREIEY